MDTLKIALVIGVTYDANGASASELKENLRAGAEYLSGIGKFTQDTEAEVETWDDRTLEGIDAAEIVKRCSAYPELIEALKECLGALLPPDMGGLTGAEHEAGCAEAEIIKARALLKSLKP